jgi:methyl-accepting chemotaxis protein
MTNPDEMAYTIIFNLVKYLEVNQGGLFLLEKEGTENAGFRLAGCYAYDRERSFSI